MKFNFDVSIGTYYIRVLSMTGVSSATDNYTLHVEEYMPPATLKRPISIPKTLLDGPGFYTSLDIIFKYKAGSFFKITINNSVDEYLGLKAEIRYGGAPYDRESYFTFVVKPGVHEYILEIPYKYWGGNGYTLTPIGKERIRN